MSLLGLKCSVQVNRDDVSHFTSMKQYYSTDKQRN